MAALDTLNTTDTTEDTSAKVTPQVTPSAPVKGSKYSLPTIKGTVGIDPSILESMQQIIAQKEAKKSSFMEGLKDVMAYDVGYRGDINKSVRERAAEREANAADIFNMKSQIAQYQAAQQQAQRQANRLSGIAGGQPGVAGTTGAPAGGVAVPPLVRDEINRRLQDNDIAGAQKVYDKWLETETTETIKMETSPGAYEKKVEVERPDGSIIYVDALTARNMARQGTGKPTGKEAPATAPTTGTGITPANIATVESGGDATAVSPKGARGVMQVMPNTQKDPGFGVTPAKDDSPAELQRVGEDYYAAMQKRYGNDTLAAIAYNMGPGATDDWLSKGADFNKLPAETQAYIGKVNLANAMSTRQPAAPAAAPAPVVSGVSGAARTREAVEKAGQEKFAQKSAEDYAGMATQIDKSGIGAGEAYNRATDILNIASDKDMQDMIGLLRKNGVAPFILKQLESGVQAGQFGSLGIKDLQKNLAEAGATKSQIEKFERLERNLANAELEWAKVYLKGQGAVSDAERALIRKAVGSINDPAKVLVMQAKIMQERAQFDKAMYEAYGAYRDKFGEQANFSKFLRTAGAPLIEKHNRDLSAIIGTPVSNNEPYKTKPSASSQEVTSEERKNWKSRYGKNN